MANAASLGIAILLLAAVYALVNVGFVVLYRTTRVINFAQGHFLLLGAYLMYFFSGRLAYAISLVLVVITIAALGAIVYLLLMRYLLGAQEFAKVITTLMFATLLAQIPAMVWGTNLHVLSPPVNSAFQILGVRIQSADIVTIGLAAAVVIALIVVIDRSILGIQMRALATNDSLAMYAGMKIHRLGAIAWGLAGAGAALAGIAYAQRTSVNVDLAAVGLSAFPAAVIGGMDSIGGTLLGGLIVASIQTIGAYYLGPIFGDIAAYLMMLMTLLILPTGLFGTRELKRL
jgi:branched-chain amino acid transport system permease protein